MDRGIRDRPPARPERRGKVDLATAHGESDDSVGVLFARPGLCTVQDVRVVTVENAKRMLARANCRLGKIRRAYSRRVEKGLVLSQKPMPGTVLPKLGKVDLRVSRGPRSNGAANSKDR